MKESYPYPTSAQNVERNLGEISHEQHRFVLTLEDVRNYISLHSEDVAYTPWEVRDEWAYMLGRRDQHDEKEDG